MGVSPRQVAKASLSAGDFCVAEVRVADRHVTCHPGARRDCKSSIDTGVQAMLYERLPYVTAMVHFHYPPFCLAVPDAVTRFPYPCGVAEEAEEVLRALSATESSGRGPLLVELAHHGFVLLLTEHHTPRAVLEEWNSLAGRGREGEPRYPVWCGAHIVGYIQCDGRRGRIRTVEAPPTLWRAVGMFLTTHRNIRWTLEGALAAPSALAQPPSLLQETPPNANHVVFGWAENVHCVCDFCLPQLPPLP